MRGLENYNIASFESRNKLGFPHVQPCRKRGELSAVKWVDFDTAFSKRDNLIFTGLHFYIDDYKFQRIWNNPKKYINFLSRFDYVIMPDFSMYYNFPQALQIYNKYRNHWLAAYFSVHGVNIVPDISLSTPDCYEWSIDGYPSNTLVAFCDIGSKRDKISESVLTSAFDYMREKLTPAHILYFTRSPVKFDDDTITVVHLPFLKGGESNG